MIALCVGLFGLMGNFAFYVLSRFIEVVIPYITDRNGQEWYLTGHSYKYFIEEYDLEFLTVLFWILFVLGMVTAFVPKEKLKKILNRLKNVKRRKRKNDNTIDELA